MNQLEFKIIDKFKNIDETVENFLYKLLAEKEFSISHRNMPTFEEHKEFIKNNPYHMWSIILLKKSMIGSIYILTDNSVGINLLKKYQFLKGDVISFVTSLNAFKTLDPTKIKSPSLKFGLL